MLLIEIKTSKAQIIYVSTLVMINSPRLVLINFWLFVNEKRQV